jgi:phosphonopyruvate decarboxylase
MHGSGRPYCLLMQKGSVAPYGLESSKGLGSSAIKARAAPSQGSQARRLSRQDALREVVARTAPGCTAILASTGYCGRELYAIADRPNHIYMVGSMGCVTPWALGLALARPDLKVLAVDGDGAALMRMGAMATVGAYGPANFKHLLLDNGVHDSTGGQATVSPRISFAGVAAACGYARAIEGDALGELAAWLEEPWHSGPSFARFSIRTGTPADLPRPSVSPAGVKNRFMRHFAGGAR